MLISLIVNSPLWTLIAALIGGKLFGVLGILFFYPPDGGDLHAEDDAERRLARRKKDGG